MSEIEKTLEAAASLLWREGCISGREFTRILREIYVLEEDGEDIE